MFSSRTPFFSRGKVVFAQEPKTGSSQCCDYFYAMLLHHLPKKKEAARILKTPDSLLYFPISQLLERQAKQRDYVMLNFPGS